MFRGSPRPSGSSAIVNKPPPTWSIFGNKNHIDGFTVMNSLLHAEDLQTSRTFGSNFGTHWTNGRLMPTAGNIEFTQPMIPIPSMTVDHHLRDQIIKKITDNISVDELRPWQSSVCVGCTMASLDRYHQFHCGTPLPDQTIT